MLSRDAPLADGAAAGTASIPDSNGCKLHVGHVPQDMSGAALRALFGTAGRVADCFLQPDPRGGRHRGFATVKMADEAAAQQALCQLHLRQARTTTALSGFKVRF